MTASEQLRAKWVPHPLVFKGAVRDAFLAYSTELLLTSFTANQSSAIQSFRAAQKL